MMLTIIAILLIGLLMGIGLVALILWIGSD